MDPFYTENVSSEITLTWLAPLLKSLHCLPFRYRFIVMICFQTLSIKTNIGSRWFYVAEATMLSSRPGNVKSTRTVMVMFDLHMVTDLILHNQIVLMHH